MIRKILAFSIALIFIFPIFFLITSSFKNNIDVFSLPPKLFLFDIDFSAYERVFGFSKLLKFDPSYGELYLTSRILDSLIVGIGSSSLTLIIGIYAGYYISRANFKYKNFLIMSILSARMMPLIAIAIPLYFVYEKINLLDTYVGLILIHTFINLPLAVLLLKSFFDEVPKQIDENAFIDGASKIKILHKLIIPCAKGGIAVTFILSIIFSWTEFICALMIGQMKIKTIPIQASIMKTIPSWDMMAAFTTISIIPVFIMILIVRKHFVRGLTLGTVKE